MTKLQHEIRDPIHNFVRVSADEVAAINSRPFQRLRSIHQLALTYLVYPGATHRRFEHSLGVMELAGRIFDIITSDANRHPDVQDIFPDRDTIRAWRKVVRLAALFHDIGHLPFSHAAEERLLPDGKHHEWMTVKILRSAEMQEIFKRMMAGPDPDQVARIAIGPEKWSKWFGKARDFDEWDLLMTEIVTGDAFGADRIDYLLRDSYHAGVAYGRFDHYRLIDTLRILRHPRLDRPMIGIENGGIHAAEALQLARQFMFLQLYYHHVRLAYDIHLSDFMEQSLKPYPIDVEGYLKMTDSEVLATITAAAGDRSADGHEPARRIVRRQHFRKVYERNALDQRRPDAVEKIAEALQKRFGEDAVRHRIIPPKRQDIEFPVLLDSGEVSTSRSESAIYADLKPAAVGVVLIDPDKRKDAEFWLAENKKQILSEQMELNL
ncbi:MAG TPA: HD domain-containing protein [Thermoanaerobaculia bacterium]|nr:HD domain-containing protein [Thermoanaerobaculia bacterium]